MQDVFFQEEDSMTQTGKKSINNSNNTTIETTKNSSPKINQTQSNLTRLSPRDTPSNCTGTPKLSDQELLSYLETISSIAGTSKDLSKTTTSSYNSTSDFDDEGLSKDLEESEKDEDKDGDEMKDNRKSISYYTTRSFHSSGNETSSLVSPNPVVAQALLTTEKKIKFNDTLCSPTEKLRRSMSVPKLSLVNFLFSFKLKNFILGVNLCL